MNLKSLCVYCGSSPGLLPSYLEAAQAFGRLIAAESITLVYGGGNVGLMGALADSVLQSGGKVIGVIPERRRCALHKDYLSDKSVRIYCGKCRIEVHPGDTKEILYVRGAEDKMVQMPNPSKWSWRDFNHFFYSFENSNDLTSRAFRLERVEPEDIESEEARMVAQQRA